jgi:hypothetical protein
VLELRKSDFIAIELHEEAFDLTVIEEVEFEIVANWICSDIFLLFLDARECSFWRGWFAAVLNCLLFWFVFWGLKRNNSFREGEEEIV